MATQFVRVLPIPKVQVFTTPGADTFDATQVPIGPDGKQWVEVEVQGGGASGAGNSTTVGGGSGGKSGEYRKGLVNVTGETNITVTVGAGATGDTGGVNPGGNSSFGSFIVALGGDASSGAETGGDVVVPQGVAGDGNGFNSPDVSYGGNGGTSPFGGPGIGAISLNTSATAGKSATGYGSGGGGAANSTGSLSANGGNGRSGIVIVRWNE